MNILKCHAVLFVVLLFAGAARAGDRLTVVIPGDSSAPVRAAANELAQGLQDGYELASCSVGEAPGQGVQVYLGTGESLPPHLTRALAGRLPQDPEGFRVTSVEGVGVVVGADDAGVVYGVYQLLEKIGHGFYLNRDIKPEQKKAFTWDDWDLANHPLVETRLAFNWHNFLSGCTSWNESDWNAWTDQTQKMGYNTIMVHAYGNNPMFQFSFNGIEKPVGVLNTSRQAYEWGTQVTNDIRRTVGGELYPDAEFGADVAKVPYEERVPAIQGMMQNVFRHAERRGVQVAFSFDIATGTANPHKILRSMAPESKVTGGLVNADSPEGAAYYRAQVEAMLNTYPEIDILVGWVRAYNGENTKVAQDKWPAAWREEYQGLIDATPALATLKDNERMFLYSKQILGYRAALDALGHEDLPLMIGSWYFKWFEVANAVFPKNIGFLGLDAAAHGTPAIEKPDGQATLRAIARDRACIPVTWAHHDDGEYVGRSYEPSANFYQKLNGSSGFGVIHWMMRPFDVYFRSLSEQTWAETQDRPLDATIDDYCRKVFGADAAAPMAVFFKDWIRHAPFLGRETRSVLFTRPVRGKEADTSSCDRRLALLDAVPTEGMSPEAVALVEYYRHMEHFLIAMIREQVALQEMSAHLDARDLEKVRALLEASRPEEAIRKYASAIASGGPDLGELGFLYQLNADWLVYFEAVREAAETGRGRVNFMATPTDRFAQSTGAHTWFIDEQGGHWRGYGSRNLKGKVFTLPGLPDAPSGLDPVYREVCQTGVTKKEGLTFVIRPLTAGHLVPGRGKELPGDEGKANGFPAGEYDVRLFFVEHEAERAGERVFNVVVDAVGPAPEAGEDDGEVEPPYTPFDAGRVDVFAQAGSQAVFEKVVPVTLADNGYARVTLTGVKGRPSICAAVIEPRVE